MTEDDVYQDGSGNLVLRTKKHGVEDYSAGFIRTKGKNEFKYGYFETRIKLPQYQGHWPAFWLNNTYVWYEPCEVGNPSPGLDSWGVQKTCGVEIDIIELPWREYGYQHNMWWYDENLGYQISAEDFSDHFKVGGASQSTPIWNPQGDYHTFGLLWTPTQYIFYVDGIETHRLDNTGNVPISDAPEYIKLTEEIDWNTSRIDVDSWAGDIRDVVEFSEDYTLVDYVRVFQLDSVTNTLAQAGTDRNEDENTLVILDGSSSLGSSLEYNWTQVENGAPSVLISNVNQALASFTSPNISSQTEFIFQLQVKDSDYTISTDIVTITVGEEVQNLNANFIFNGSSSIDGQYTFTDTSSGFISSRLWNFGDGSNSIQINPIHIFTESGTYTVTLTVYDGSGGSHSNSQEIIVVLDNDLENDPDNTSNDDINSGASDLLAPTGINYYEILYSFFLLIFINFFLIYQHIRKK